MVALVLTDYSQLDNTWHIYGKDDRKQHSFLPRSPCLTFCELSRWRTMCLFWRRCGGGRVWTEEGLGWLPAWPLSQGLSGMTPLADHRHRDTYSWELAKLQHALRRPRDLQNNTLQWRMLIKSSRSRCVPPDKWVALKMNQRCTVP